MRLLTFDLTLIYRPGSVFTFFLLLYFIIKSVAFHWYQSDENIYFYLAKYLSLQNLPYRDFFYANPPILLLLLKITGSVSQWSLFGLRCLPIIASAFSGWVVFHLYQEKLKWLAILPVCLFGFSYDALRASTHATGINTTLAFVMASLLFMQLRRPIFSGLLFALAIGTKFYAITALPLLLFLLLKHPRQSWLRFLLSAGSLISLMTFLCLLVGGNAFMDMNFAYHMSKPVDESSEVFSRVIEKNQGTLWVILLLFLLFLFSRREPNQNLFNPDRVKKFLHQHSLLAGSLLHLLVVTLFLYFQNRIFDFYFLLFLPGLCLLMGELLGLLLESPPSKWTFTRNFLVCFITLLVFIQPLIPGNFRLFLRNYVSYWQHESRTIDALENLVPKVRQSNGLTLSGDSATAPVLALMADIPLALGEADTNIMRFQTGRPYPPEFIQKLEQSGNRLLLARSDVTGNQRRLAGMFFLSEFEDYAQHNFISIASLRLDRTTIVDLLLRKD